MAEGGRQTILPGGLSYFEYQRLVATEVVIPWLDARLSLDGAAIGDFGAHQGGMLDALRGIGTVRSGTGFELSADVVSSSPFSDDRSFRLEVADLTALDAGSYAFDVVLLHDVLEHIPNGSGVLKVAAEALSPHGHVFVSFPPYHSAFGGHQHLARGRARIIPFVQHLPTPVFRRVARPGASEYMTAEESLADLLSVRATRLTLSAAEKAFRVAGLEIVDRELFVLRPEYTVRYGLPTVSAGFIGRLPWVREFVVTGAFFLARRRHSGDNPSQAGSGAGSVP